MMNYKKGDVVEINDSGVIKTAVVVKDGLDNKGRVRVKPTEFPFEISITVEPNENLYIKTK